MSLMKQTHTRYVTTWMKIFIYAHLRTRDQLYLQNLVKINICCWYLIARNPPVWPGERPDFTTALAHALSGPVDSKQQRTGFGPKYCPTSVTRAHEHSIGKIASNFHHQRPIRGFIHVILEDEESVRALVCCDKTAKSGKYFPLELTHPCILTSILAVYRFVWTMILAVVRQMTCKKV